MTFNTISYQPKATAEPKGLNINAQKTKSIRINSKQTDIIKISNTEVKDIKYLTYCLTTEEVFQLVKKNDIHQRPLIVVPEIRHDSI